MFEKQVFLLITYKYSVFLTGAGPRFLLLFSLTLRTMIKLPSEAPWGELTVRSPRPPWTLGVIVSPQTPCSLCSWAWDSLGLCRISVRSREWGRTEGQSSSRAPQAPAGIRGQDVAPG